MRLIIAFFYNSYKTINVLILFHTGNQKSSDKTLVNDSEASSWAIDASQPQALDDRADSRSTQKILEVRWYDRFCQLILATKASDPKLDFHENGTVLLRRQHPLVPRLQQFSIP